MADLTPGGGLADGLALAVVAMWTAGALMAVVGICRHVVRAVADQAALDELTMQGEAALPHVEPETRRQVFYHTRLAAQRSVRGEYVRVALKGLLLGMAVPMLSLSVSKWLDPAAMWDVRELMVPALFVVALGLLTWWSNWERDVLLRETPPSAA